MVDLSKKTEMAGAALVSLAKEATTDLGEVSAQVAAVMDGSTSMSSLYNNGAVQEAFERIIATSLTGLDDDGVVPAYVFHKKAVKLPDVTEANIDGYVDNNRPALEPYTQYAEGIEAVVKEAGQKRGLFHKSGPADIPTLVFFFTDGQPGDSDKTKKLIAKYSDLPIFWIFVGIGGLRPAILDELDNMSGRLLDNVSFVPFDPWSFDRDDIQKWFEDALREFITQWIPAARAKGIIK